MEKKIMISYDVDQDKLILSDHGHTNAGKSDQIHWHPGEGVKAVTNVSVKPESPISTEKFWSNAPHDNGVNFKGTIKNDVEDGGAWDYNITCNIGSNNDPNYKYVDPRIQVNSTIETSPD